MNFMNEDEYIIYSGDHFKIEISDLDEEITMITIKQKKIFRIFRIFKNMII